MYRKDRRLVDSKTKDRQGLTGLLTKSQYDTLELILNASYEGCLIYDRRVGALYKKGMTPCTLNDIWRAIGKKVDKLFKVLEGNSLVKKVIDMRGREVWMINPDLYWDYVGWELYYNRWLFSLGSHREASKVVNLSLHYGYYYHSTTGESIKKIPKFHWDKMCKWWYLSGNDTGLNLLNFEGYQPKSIIE